MPIVLVEIFIVFLLIVANGVFSGSEIAIISARKTRLGKLAEKGDYQAGKALKLANSPNDFLSAVQIGITLIGILSGAFGSATLSERLEPIFAKISILAPYSETLSVAIIVSIITYLSLVVGELLPKRIALNSPEKIACATAPLMTFLSKITTPLIYLLSFSTETLLKVFGIKTINEPNITEEEIQILIRQGAASGIFEEAEHNIVERVFRLGDYPIQAMMTPRLEVVWLDINDAFEDNLQKVIESNYSRFPVGQETLDECVGFVRGKNLLMAKLSGEVASLDPFIQQPLFVPEIAKVLSVIKDFQETGIHIAIVTNEYGGVEGIVTLNDLMEAMVGDLPSIEHHEEPLIIQREDGSWLLDGSLDVSELRVLFGQDFLPENTKFYTVAGFMIHFLEHIPQSGEYFEWKSLRFEVVDMDGARIDKVLAKALSSSDDASKENIDNF
ncbi:hypothetical protein NIES970_28400 (plasmid) [[Synechococcus] sp. NIES-970]|nr:hypothetical protein NIES970_28400 [[Synechococcus] sp. NIES-970]